LHNYQDGVSIQIDVPLQKDASFTNSTQEDFQKQKNFLSATQPNPIPSIHINLQTLAKVIEAGSKNFE
jgi:hypothetical protein